MSNIVIFGAPGAGKGTQSEKMVEKYAYTHLSTGDIFRKHLSQNTELGKLAKSYMDKGELVPDAVTIQLLEHEVLQKKPCKGFIFDGFPRTISQAEALDSFLSKHGEQIDCVLGLEVPEEELVKRILLRGATSGRADDQNGAIIQGRIAEYNKKTASLIAFYQKQNKYKAIDGTQSVEQIFSEICAYL